MKFRNLSLVFIFVFFASLMVFCLCRQAEDAEEEQRHIFTWHVPPSIQARYPDLSSTKAELEKRFEALIADVSKKHGQGNAHGQIGQILESHHAVFYVPDQSGKIDTRYGQEEISDFFSGHAGHPFSVSEIEVTCFDMERPGAVGEDAIDFVVVVRFKAFDDQKLASGEEVLDPPGEVIYYHRKICTIDN